MMYGDGMKRVDHLDSSTATSGDVAVLLHENNAGGGRPLPPPAQVHDV